MATILENEAAWSTTALTNANVDTGINWIEGQDAATVNNSARGMMAARRKATLDQGGALQAGGTADALTVTTNQVLSAAHLAPGLPLVVQATAVNTIVAPTLAVDGLTAAPIKRADGTALAVGSIQSGMFLDLVYTGSSDWRAMNIAPVALSGAGRASFSAHKNFVDQAVASTSPNQVTWSTEIFDTGSRFAANVWTPPAGIVLVTASILLNNYDAGGWSLSIYKSGTLIKSVYAATPADLTISVIDQTTGTATYYVGVATSTDASYTISGNAAQSWFMGTML